MFFSLQVTKTDAGLAQINGINMFTPQLLAG